MGSKRLASSAFALALLASCGGGSEVFEAECSEGGGTVDQVFDAPGLHPELVTRIDVVACSEERCSAPTGIVASVIDGKVEVRGSCFGHDFVRVTISHY